MLSDEELKEIEAKLDSAHREDCACGECIGFDIAYEGCVEPLLAEVKRLRSLMQGQTITSEPGWQSVADGAKPGPEDWYVARVRHEIELHGGCDVRSLTYHGVHMPGGEGFANVTHFLVIPPPPIKRES